MNIKALLDLPYLKEDLARLELRLRESVMPAPLGHSDDDDNLSPFFEEVTTHLIAAGGKRLRPMLALAAATLGNTSATADDLEGAVAVELVHLGSLYHDDVMDEASARRNVESVNARWGNLVAIVAGDYLLARSAEIAARLGSEIAELLAITLGHLCQGQMSEVRSTFKPTRSIEGYLNTIAYKTASLMATSCRIGALTAKLEDQYVESLTLFGKYFGMGFQIRDDVLDIVGTEDQLGKPPGQDLAEGVYTLPVLAALADKETGPPLRSLLGRPLNQAEVNEARALVASSPALDAAMAMGRYYVDKASEAAAKAPTDQLGEALDQLARSMLDALPLTTSNQYELTAHLALSEALLDYS